MTLGVVRQVGSFITSCPPISDDSDDARAADLQVVTDRSVTTTVRTPSVCAVLGFRAGTER